jgi:hypothetical protein
MHYSTRWSFARLSTIIAAVAPVVVLAITGLAAGANEKHSPAAGVSRGE